MATPFHLLRVFLLRTPVDLGCFMQSLEYSQSGRKKPVAYYATIMRFPTGSHSRKFPGFHHGLQVFPEQALTVRER